jgi:pimeloyl-ACP methyl ester carboxylesterase
MQTQKATTRPVRRTAEDAVPAAADATPGASEATRSPSDPGRSTPVAMRAQLFAGLPLADRRLRLAGIPTAVLEGGDGPPLLLLHGPGEFAGVWLRVIPQLLATHRVIVPDLPGHGESGLPDAPLDAARTLAWLDELIAATTTAPPVLVGHLLGGALAARHAIAHPDSVRALVLVDALGLGPFRPALRFALAMAGFVARPNERSQERLFRGCFTDLDGVRRDIGEQWQPLAGYALERARTPELQAALRRMMPAFALRAIPSADLEALAVPTTLIWGRHDLQVRLRVAEAASARYGWPLHVIEDAGDDPAFEQPAAFLRALHAAIDFSREADS